MNGGVHMPTTVLDELYKAHPDRDFLIVSHPIDRALHAKVSAMITARKKDRGVTLFLTTYGGDANAGYRLARALRNHYNHVRVVVPSYCKSAGTLITIAADEIAIGDLGELGPLDVQVWKGSEILERNSGLDITQALQAVTEHAEDLFKRILVSMRGLGLATKLSSEVAANLAGSIASPLIAQIDPMRVAEMQRAVAVAYAYGQRLDNYSSNLKEGALDRLIAAYPAHGFVIDRKESKELFHRVEKLTEPEKNFCNAGWEHLEKQGEIAFLVPPHNEQPASGEIQNEPQKNNEDLHQGAGVPSIPEQDGDGRGTKEDQSNANGQGLSDGPFSFVRSSAPIT